MIIESLFRLFLNLVNIILDKLPTIPQIPVEISDSIFNFIDLIFEHIGLLGVFLPLNLLKTVVPMWLIVEAGVSIYAITMWVIKKIPFVDIH